GKGARVTPVALLETATPEAGRRQTPRDGGACGAGPDHEHVDPIVGRHRLRSDIIARRLPGSLKHQHRPTPTRLRADMPHPEMLIRLPYFRFERPRDAGENESAAVPHTSNEDRRHLDQRSGEDGRHD